MPATTPVEPVRASATGQRRGVRGGVLMPASVPEVPEVREIR